MLKSAYKNAIDKYVPDSTLIESTKNAMRSELSAQSFNDDKSAVIAVASQGCKKIGFWQKNGKVAAGAACIVLMIGTAVGVSAYLDNDDNNLKQDTFASSGHSGFDGNAANDGNGSVVMDITETTTTAVTTVANVQNIHNNTQSQTTKAVSTTTAATQAQGTTEAQVTSIVMQTTTAQTTTTAKTTSATTSLTTTATTAQTSRNSVTTTTAVPEPEDDRRPHFDYYDPQYDPNFKGGFGGDFGEEFLFEHQGIFYYFDMHKSDKVKVDIDGHEFTLRNALDSKKLMPEDLLEFEGFICKGYYNDDKNAEPINIHPEYEQQMQQQGGFMQAEDEMFADEQSGGYIENPVQDCDCSEEIPQE